MLATGVLLLLLAPGVAAYAALYGLFHSGKAIAPEPPGANTLETVTIIGGVSLVMHAVCAAAFAFNDVICDAQCPIKVKPAWLDPYHGAVLAMSGTAINGVSMALALAGVTAQATVAYVAIRLWLRRLATRDQLPAWIYGWATPLANTLDDDDRAVIAYVLTKTECDGRTLAYGGLVHNLSLKPDGSVIRIALTECERYLVDLTSSLDDASLSKALSRFSFMTIEADNIENIAFEAIDLGVAPNNVDGPDSTTISAA